jgi:DNA-binding NarL/FixJ family response regulator
MILDPMDKIGSMNKKQKEGLVLALYEKGKTYREITKEAGVSPNTIKAIVNKAGSTKFPSTSGNCTRSQS